MKSFNISRKKLLQLSGLGLMYSASLVHGASIRRGRIIDPNKKLNIACVGCSGKGAGDIRGVSSENIVALCDVDHNLARPMFKKFPKARQYKDYRKMLREMDKKIDAVTVSTPDHMHFPVAMAAIRLGKHVFVQKPLTHTIKEARDLLLAAGKHNVITQMGNQGHAKEGIRLMREWYEAGAIGKVKEVHVWSSKATIGKYKSALKTRPTDRPPVPKGLDWNLWLGVAPKHSYHPEYHPKKWRHWWDFGCGTLGDIGCHTMDSSFWGLGLGAPESIEAKTSSVNDATSPDWSIITYKFPKRGKQPAVKMI